MPLPTYSPVLFEKDQLRLVVAQVRFPVLFRFSEKPFLAPFHGALKQAYPRIAEEQQIVAMRASPKGVETKAESLWRFSDRNGDWSVLLGENALTIETRRYSNIDDLLQRFGKVLDAASQHLDVMDRTRIGLRFVNEFRSSDATELQHWSKLLNPDFLGIKGMPALLEGEIGHSFNELRCVRSDGTLVVRHGLLSGTTVEPRPQDAPPASGSFYLLDVDYFEESQIPMDRAETITRFRTYNEQLYQLFRWTLDGGTLYQQLGPR